MDTSDYVAGGYIITKYRGGNDDTWHGLGFGLNQWLRDVCGATEDLFTDTTLSVAFCGRPALPVFSWTGATDEEYEAYGVPVERRIAMHQWADEKFNISIGYPNIFFSLVTAREYIQRFTTAPDIQLLGIGVHQQDLHLITELELRRPDQISPGYAPIMGFAGTGLAQALRLADQCAPGEIVGFDVICCEYNIDHSWNCNGLPVAALREFNFRPNQFGLIDGTANADKLAGWIRADEDRGEPGMWLPVLVSRYSLTENATPHQ